MEKHIKTLFALSETYQKLSLPIRAGIWFTLCNFLQKGISFITIPFFTRIMTVEQYGLYSIYMSWYTILTIFGTLHLSYYVFDKGMVKYSDDRNEFVVSIQCLSLLLGTVLFVLYITLYQYVNALLKIPTAMMLCMLLQIFFEPPILYWTARKRFEYKYHAVVLVTIFIAIINPLLGIILIKSNIFTNEALARVLSVSSITLFSGIVFGAIIIYQAKKIFSSKYWKYALAFNVPLIPHFLSTTVLASADRIMIGDMIGKGEAGLYSVANSLAMAYTLFCQSFHHAYLPWLYRKIKGNDIQGIDKKTNIFLIVMIGLISFSICFAPEIIYILGSTKYADSIWVIPPVCGSVFFIFLRDLFANIEYYFEETKLISLASFSIAILNICLNYLFISRYGYVAAGFTTLLCYVILALTHFFVMKHVCYRNKIDYKLFFNTKIILMLSILMISIILAMIYVYRYTVVRYLILFGILIVAFHYRAKLIALFKSLKS